MLKDSMKENNKPAGFKPFASVLKPIREWLHTMKSSTPISGPIIINGSPGGSSGGGGGARTSTSGSSNQQHHNLTNNSYSQVDILAGRNSADMLSSTAIHRYTPGSINGMSNGASQHHHHQNHHHQLRNHLNGGHSGIGPPAPPPRPPSTMMMTMDDLNGSTMGSNNSGLLDGGGQFSRNAQARMSLPIMQQNKLRRQAYSQLQRRGQQPPRSLGHIYLQHKGETKQANLPNELTTIDTIRALFVCAFPRLLTMEYMSQPHVKIYIYNPSCNIFYELCDIEDVKHESVLRIHHSDPLVPLGVLPPHQQVPQIVPQHYATIHRLPPRMPPQIPPPPLPPQQILAHMQQQQQQQAHQQQQQQQQQHHLHHQLAPQLSASHLPPPKPRRMIPASYSMHRLNPQV